ncbi:MAG: HK97 family phage prohead protease [Dehalobacter sp.]|nr:HK97 family phage prohead protease [Dehalobacter sp.]
MKKNKKKLPVKSEPVIRSFGIEDLRAVDEGTYIEGHPAVYDQKANIGNWFYEIIERGAFDDCDFDDVLFSANHGWIDKIPLARSRRNNGNSTMTLVIDEKGLYIKANLDIEANAEAKSLYSAVKRGDIDGMSFIFYVQEEKWEDLDKDVPTRRIQKIKKVREVSAVNYPAYTGTDINARDQAMLDNAARVLENARSELENSKNELERVKLRTQILMKG